MSGARGINSLENELHFERMNHRVQFVLCRGVELKSQGIIYTLGSVIRDFHLRGGALGLVHKDESSFDCK